MNPLQIIDTIINQDKSFPGFLGINLMLCLIDHFQNFKIDYFINKEPFSDLMTAVIWIHLPNGVQQLYRGTWMGK